jgi:type II secretory pathway pseudopilin PulG
MVDTLHTDTSVAEATRSSRVPLHGTTPLPPSLALPRRPRRNGRREVGNGPRRRRGAARGYTLVEMVGVVIIIAILLKMVIPNLMRGSDAARKNTMISDLRGYHSQAALHYQDFHQYPTAIQASGSPTTATMTFPTSEGVGIRITNVSQDGYTIRARSVDLRKVECSVTVSKTSGFNPQCTDLAAEWAGTDPAA